MGELRLLIVSNREEIDHSLFLEWVKRSKKREEGTDAKSKQRKGRSGERNLSTEGGAGKVPTSDQKQNPGEKRYLSSP